MRIVVWLKDDLRIEDNPAVSLAMGEAGPPYVTFLHTDEALLSHVRPTERRRARQDHLLSAMERVIEKSGSRLVRIPGDADNFMQAIAEIHAQHVYANIQIGDNLSYARDREVARRLKASGITYHEFCADGIGRGRRKGPPPFIAGAQEHPWFHFPETPEPIRRLRRFLKKLPGAGYRENMWVPSRDEEATSRLSVDIACGALSVDRVLHETQIAMAQDPRNPAWNQFAARASWRRGFVQQFEYNVDNFPWHPHREERPEDADRMKAWLGGETGFPLVDAAMRQLASEGWANFRMRQVVSSFALDLLDLDPFRTGIALGELFDDYTPGIHWMQIARQSGMMVGVGPRVVNPIKQAQDLDREGVYVRRWIPELREIPAAAIFEPWRYEGYKGPRPIVDYKSAARAARERRHPTGGGQNAEVSGDKEKRGAQMSLFGEQS